MNVFARLDTWLRPAAPATRLALARILVGTTAVVYLLARFRYFADLSRHDATELASIGVVRVLAAPLPAAVTWTLASLAVLFGAAFVAGVRHRLTGPLFFLLLLWVTTYRSSWGKILHTENLLVIHVFLLAIAPAADALSFDARREASKGDERAYGWTLRAMTIAVALTYFVAGVSKLRAGGGAWWSGQALGDWLAYDALRKIELGSYSSPLGPILAASPAALRVLAIYTLIVELGAPFVLASPRASRVWCLLAWGFHLGILASMAILFFYPLSFVAFAPFFGLERAPILRRLSAKIER